MLTVEFNPKDECVELYCDEEGLDVLGRALAVLRDAGGHEHLMTPSWAGHELTEDKQNPANQLIHHLLICVKPTSKLAQADPRGEVARA